MKSFIAFLLVLLLVGVVVVSCSKREPDPPPVTAFQSVHGGYLSHRNGEICLSCHVTGGAAARSFVVAGSVYQADLIAPSINGTLYFWSNPGGTGNLLATLQVDGLGNFFTTMSILPGDSVFPQIRSNGGDIRVMPITTPNGNCNSCHGQAENPIWVN